MAKGFLGLNPVAVGILVGSLGGPAGAALGAGIGAMYDSAQGKKRDALQAMNNQVKAGVANQNALVQKAYQKKLGAKGLGDMADQANTSASGIMASQTGAVLTSPTGESTNLLG